MLQHQSGTPFARTFVQTLNYGNAGRQGRTVRAAARRTSPLFNLRTPRRCSRVSRARVIRFYDVYNVFNADAAQAPHRHFGRFLAETDGRQQDLASSASAPEWTGNS